MQECVLETCSFAGQHSADICSELKRITDEWGSTDTDNCENMVAAVRKAGWAHYPCFAHTLNLGAQSIYAIGSVAKWTARIRDVVVWMRRSAMAKVVLKEKQRALSK